MLQSYGLAPGPLLEIATALCMAGNDMVDPGCVVDETGFPGMWL